MNSHHNHICSPLVSQGKQQQLSTSTQLLLYELKSKLLSGSSYIWKRQRQGTRQCCYYSLCSGIMASCALQVRANFYTVPRQLHPGFLQLMPWFLSALHVLSIQIMHQETKILVHLLHTSLIKRHSFHSQGILSYEKSSKFAFQSEAAQWPAGFFVLPCGAQGVWCVPLIRELNLFHNYLVKKNLFHSYITGLELVWILWLIVTCQLKNS